MQRMGARLGGWISLALAAGAAADAGAQSIAPTDYAHLHWRMIGPFRGGRTVAASGVPGRRNVFYVGANNGGVWKSTDAGRVWRPIFDDQPTGSIGALAVAPSAPDTLYVGSGEGLQRPDLSTGDGVYRSTDGGATWTHLGLRDGQQISAIVVDPRDARRLFVAVLGHPYGPNPQRGVFRSSDGGDHFEKVLGPDDDTGAVALCCDPQHPDTLYAALWASRQAPWENGAWQGPGSGLFKSSDGGTTWRKLEKGLPTFAQGLGRIGFDVARSDPRILFAMVDAKEFSGVYRSEDAGDSWRRVNSEPRLCSRGTDFAEVRIHPRDPRIVFVGDTSVYRSDDGGEHFTCFRGAPGGDDFHTLWIDPDEPDTMLFASDQGAIVTVNGGETFSSWYNQPTAQLYHVSTDDQIPYHVYGGQQESGSVGITSRGATGQITFADWAPVGADEYAYVAPDPLHPDLIYGGRVSRFDRRTGRAIDVAPPGLRTDYRVLRTAPLLFSTVDPRVLFFGANVLFRTVDGGDHWDRISPDLSREQPAVPPSIGSYATAELATMPRRGVIYSIAPSHHDVAVIWAGTDDGRIHLTRDGGASWREVTPTALTAWSKVAQLEAGWHDGATCYAAVNRLRLDDLRPHLWRTHDYGATWQEIVDGLPDDTPANTVREDPVRPGLLFCGLEGAVHVSFDDGDGWLPLRVDMPATSIRDLVVHRDDVVVGTHGRGFWILDDIAVLRQLGPAPLAAAAWLYAPADAWLLPRSLQTDTPLPREEPAGENPPDGALIEYRLGKPAATPIVIEITTLEGALVRRFASDDPPDRLDPRELRVEERWARPPQALATSTGVHRFVWDLHGPPPASDRRGLPISAIDRATPIEPRGALAAPGLYRVVLTVDGGRFEQRLTLHPDPQLAPR